MCNIRVKGSNVSIFLAFMIIIASASSLEAVVDRKAKERAIMRSDKKKRIILLGASIGRAWNFSSLPERINTGDYVLEYVDGGSFDKSVKLCEILSRSQNKPDAIFIKECAAYFPGNFHEYKSLMERWVQECNNADVTPIPTTVVPVTRLHSFKKAVIDIVKLRNPLKYGSPFKQKRNAAILEYNDWIRTFCVLNGLAWLDLEAAVRYNEKKRYLRRDLAKLDGLHLNRKAYRILDQIIIPTLEKVNWERKIKKSGIAGE